MLTRAVTSYQLVSGIKKSLIWDSYIDIKGKFIVDKARVHVQRAKFFFGIKEKILVNFVDIFRVKKYSAGAKQLSGKFLMGNFQFSHFFKLFSSFSHFFPTISIFQTEVYSPWYSIPWYPIPGIRFLK